MLCGASRPDGRDAAAMQFVDIWRRLVERCNDGNLHGCVNPASDGVPIGWARNLDRSSRKPPRSKYGCPSNDHAVETVKGTLDLWHKPRRPIPGDLSGIYGRSARSKSTISLSGRFSLKLTIGCAYRSARICL